MKSLSGDETREALHAYGLDRPLTIQFFSWVGRALVGDFGQSYFFHDDVASLIARRPSTLISAL